MSEKESHTLILSLGSRFDVLMREKERDREREECEKIGIHKQFLHFGDSGTKEYILLTWSRSCPKWGVHSDGTLKTKVLAVLHVKEPPLRNGTKC